MAEPTPGYLALRSGVAAGPIGRDVVTVAGPDAESYLQGQLSADVLALAAGSSAWTWLLQPAGKVEVLARVSRIDGQTFALDTDSGWGEGMLARLARFRLRAKLDLEVVDWSAIALRGPDARPPATGEGTAVVADASFPGLVGHDLLGPAPAVPGGATPLTADELEVARVEAGIPRMGTEIDERTIPAETGLVARTVSFTKGCYTGQELVARIDSRGGNVPRRLLGLRLDAPVGAGAALLSGERDAGVVTSPAESPQLGPIALAYVRRAVDVGDTVAVGDVRAVVVELPFVA